MRTFLEVIATGNFQLAAKRIHVTQAAVSMRIKRLEEELGRPVFTRSKAGAELTKAGEQFERYARSMLKAWEDGKYHVSVPDGYEDTLIIGCQYSLWPRLGIRWLKEVQRNMHDIAVRAEVGMPDRLIRMMLDGLLDIAVVYTPQLRPGFEVEPILEDTLVLASTDANYPADLDERYMLVDWGEEFLRAHKSHYPDIKATGVTLALGSLSSRYIMEVGGAGYFPSRTIEEFVEDGRLHIIPDAPAFPFPAYVVINSDKDENLIAAAITELKKTAARIDDHQTEFLEEAGVSDLDNSLTNESFADVLHD